jgi:hypothetical protein
MFESNSKTQVFSKENFGSTACAWDKQINAKSQAFKDSSFGTTVFKAIND